MELIPSAAPPRVVAFTDGGCRGNPGAGGWGFLLIDRVSGKALAKRGGEADTTNNRMEMLAAIEALRTLKREGTVVEVRSDSQYLVNMCTRWMAGWKKKGWTRKGNDPIKNLDLVKELDRLQHLHQVRWTWVRGHAGDVGNEYADRLTNEAMDAVQAGRDPHRTVPLKESPVRLGR